MQRQRESLRHVSPTHLVDERPPDRTYLPITISAATTETRGQRGVILACVGAEHPMTGVQVARWCALPPNNSPHATAAPHTDQVQASGGGAPCRRPKRGGDRFDDPVGRNRPVAQSGVPAVCEHPGECLVHRGIAAHPGAAVDGECLAGDP